MKLGILGTRGIPNHHGGFEQFAEYFSVYAAKMGWEVYVYNSSIHPYKQTTYKGVNIIHVKDFEDSIGTPGQFIYDFNAIMDARKRNFDVVLQLGYTSNSVWKNLLPKKAVIVTNMDGLEWKRTKYSNKVKAFLKYAEKWAVVSSDYLISDSIGIQDYIQKKYKRSSKYIAYGANSDIQFNKNLLTEFNLTPDNYNMLVARIEPENNIEMILEGQVQSNKARPLLVVGDANKTKFGKYLLDKFNKESSILFVGAIYNQDKLNSLRHFSHLYFHGHSVGGTNPSLLEAMASKCCIAAHENVFNQSILKEAAYYFESNQDVSELLNTVIKNENFIQINHSKIKEKFNWEAINQQYLTYLQECCHAKTTS